LNWQFSSLYIDQQYTPPLIVNGEVRRFCCF